MIVTHISRFSYKADNYSIVNFSSTQPYVLDYKERKNVYLFSASALTLTVGTIGTISVTVNEWQELRFPESTNITTNSAQLTQVLILCTDNRLTRSN